MFLDMFEDEYRQLKVCIQFFAIPLLSLSWLLLLLLLLLLSKLPLSSSLLLLLFFVVVIVVVVIPSLLSVSLLNHVLQLVM